MDIALKDYLDKIGVKYNLYKHPPVFTVAQSEKMPEIKKIKGIGTKNLFLKDEAGRFYLVVLPGIKRLNIKKLENYLEVKHLQFGSPEELKNELFLSHGSVSIFGMIKSKNTLLIIDREVWNAEISNFHPNINTETLELKHIDLEGFVKSLSSLWKIISL